MLFSQTTFIASTVNSSGAIVIETVEITENNDSIISAYYPNDSLAYTYKLYKGKPSGIYKVYFPNGKIKYRSIFMNGVLNGSWKEFSDKGKLIITGAYSLGKKDGSWHYFQEKKVEVYKNGIPKGRWRIDEGWVPRTLFVYKKGVNILTKRKIAKNSILE